MLFWESFCFDKNKYTIITFRYIISKLIENQNIRGQITQFGSSTGVYKNFQWRRIKQLNGLVYKVSIRFKKQFE